MSGKIIYENLSMAELRAECEKRGISAARSAEATRLRLTEYDVSVSGSPTGRAPSEPEMQSLPTGSSGAVEMPVIEAGTDLFHAEERALLHITGFTKVTREDGTFGYLGPKGDFITTTDMVEAISPAARSFVPGGRIMVELAKDHPAMLLTLATHAPGYNENVLVAGKSETLGERLFGFVDHITKPFDMISSLMSFGGRAIGGLVKGAGIQPGSAAERGQTENWLNSNPRDLDRSQTAPRMPLVSFFTERALTADGHYLGTSDSSSGRPAGSYRAARRNEAKLHRRRLKKDIRAKLREAAA